MLLQLTIVVFKEIPHLCWRFLAFGSCYGYSKDHSAMLWSSEAWSRAEPCFWPGRPSMRLFFLHCTLVWLYCRKCSLKSFEPSISLSMWYMWKIRWWQIHLLQLRLCLCQARDKLKWFSIEFLNVFRNASLLLLMLQKVNPKFPEYALVLEWCFF